MRGAALQAGMRLRAAAGFVKSRAAYTKLTVAPAGRSGPQRPSLQAR